jgi:hypothetical protein
MLTREYAQVRSAIEYLACMGDKQETFLFAAFPFPRINVPVVCIAQVHTSAAFFGNATCQGDLDSQRFNAAGFLIGSRSIDVRAVCENTAVYTPSCGKARGANRSHLLLWSALKDTALVYYISRS